MGIGDAVVLGILQGLTEFLPVSSSGHLVLGKALLGIAEQGITFEVFVHFGTLGAVLTIFRKDVYNLITSFFVILKTVWSKEQITDRYRNDANVRLVIYILVATLPAVVVGLLFESQIETAFSSPRLVGVTLIITAALLLLSLIPAKKFKPLSFGNTLVMGFAQALAILPGISRSGSTISIGLVQKVSGDDAARFSFLLAVPAILGATILKVGDLFVTGIDSGFFWVLLVGTVSSYLSGYFAIESLLRIVRKGKLYLFAPYCLVLGIVALFFI